MPTVYDTGVLTGVVNSLQVPPSFLVDTYFGTVQTEESEEIHFDVEDDVMSMAPFVSPVVEGQIVNELGYTTKTFKPAYVKPKTPVNPVRALKRAPGEPIAGNLSNAARMERIVAGDLMMHRKMIDRRREWMAAQVLRTGSVTVSGEKYATQVVNFGRAGALTIVKSVGSKWGDAGISPLDDMQAWGDLMLTNSGSTGRDVVMETSAWTIFRKDAQVEKRLDVLRVAGAPTLSLNAKLDYGGTYMGTIDGFNIYVYAGTYRDDAGAVQKMLPTGTVLMVGALDGVQAYGAIQDEDAGLQALPYFSKSWTTPDPGRRFIMTQSAPLMVPSRPNASLCATVL
jgi:hypothetical protein